MSRFIMDRVLKDVGTFQPQLKRYLEDPSGYTDGMDLEPAGREALEACDTGALWTLGAHPFILLSFVRNIGVARGRPPAEVIRDYKAAIRPLGRPDYSS